LRRWAEDGKVRITEVDDHRTYVRSPETAARETDFYRLEHPELDKDLVPPLFYETLLSKLEGNANRVAEALLEHGPAGMPDTEAAALFALHLAVSVTRGRAFRAESQELLNDYYRLQYANVTDAGIAKRLRDAGIEPTPEEIAENREFLDALLTGEAWFQQPDAVMVARSVEAAYPLSEHLLDRRWRVFRTPPILVTCDEPVVALGGPGSPRGERAGVENAGAVIYPLDPSNLLVMFHPKMQPLGAMALDHIETAEINREMVVASTRWAFERPTRQVAMGLRVPPRPARPFFREGPLPQAKGAVGDLYRFSRPTRWEKDPDAPPWPVARWWTGWRAPRVPRLSELRAGEVVRVRIDPRTSPRDRKRRQVAERKPKRGA
jgi:hypothetical protein